MVSGYFPTYPGRDRFGKRIFFFNICTSQQAPSPRQNFIFNSNETQLAKKGSATVSKGKRMLLFLIQW